MIYLVISLLLSIGACYTFEDFVKDYRKNYNQEQYPFRKEIFSFNYSKIINLAQQDSEFSVGVTNFTDWTQAELDRYLNAKEDPKAFVTPFPQDLERVSAPMTLSWTNFGKITPVKDQGYCGACVPFAVAAIFQSYIAIKNNISADLSEQFLLECTPYSSCLGGSIDLTFSTALNSSNFGLPPQTAYSYKAYKGIYNPTVGICGAQNRINYSKYTTMYRYANITTLQLKNLIYASPVIAAIAVLDYTFLSYKSGYYRCPKNATLFELNHVVTIVGYDSAGNWLIKNSWGLSWGHGGFGWILGSADCGLKYWIYQLNQKKVTSFEHLIVMSIKILLIVLGIVSQ